MSFHPQGPNPFGGGGQSEEGGDGYGNYGNRDNFTSESADDGQSPSQTRSHAAPWPCPCVWLLPAIACGVTTQRELTLLTLPLSYHGCRRQRLPESSWLRFVRLVGQRWPTRCTFWRRARSSPVLDERVKHSDLQRLRQRRAVLSPQRALPCLGIVSLPCSLITDQIHPRAYFRSLDRWRGAAVRVQTVSSRTVPDPLRMHSPLQ